MKLLKHRAECQKRGKKDKIFCDDWGFSFKIKKNIKAHCKNQLKFCTKAYYPKECEICENKFKSDRDYFTKKRENYGKN